MASDERALAAFPYAVVPRRPKGPEGKVRDGIHQSQRRYRPVVCTNRRVLVYDSSHTFHPRGLLGAFPAAEVRAMDLRPGRWGGRVLVLHLPGEGEVPFELGKKDLPDLGTVLGIIGGGL